MGPLLHPDIHQRQLVAFGLEPEINGILLLGGVLVVKDDIGEPAIALHAAHALDLVEEKIEIGVELGIVEDEGAVLGALGDHLLELLVDLLFGEGLRGLLTGSGRSSGSGGVVFGKVRGSKNSLRLLDVLVGVLEEGCLRILAGEAVDLASARSNLP